MPKTQQSRGAAAVPNAADAAAAFADGHVDPVQPITGSLSQAALSDAADPLETVRQAERVALTEDVLDHDISGKDEALDLGISNGFIILLCSGKPGFRRGGMSHPPRAEYPLNSFTQEQLDEFEAEPRIELVAVGGTPIPRVTRLYGADPLLHLAPRDPRLAGEAAEAAISRPPNRADPGLRNAAAARAPSGFSTR